MASQLHCNASDVNAKSEDCRYWCKNHKTDCTRLNLINDCILLNPTSCTQASVDQIKNDCLDYEIWEEQGGLMLGSYQCSQPGITKLLQDCEKFSVYPCDSQSADNARIIDTRDKLDSRVESILTAQNQEVSDVLDGASWINDNGMLIGVLAVVAVLVVMSIVFVIIIKN